MDWIASDGEGIEPAPRWKPWGWCSQVNTRGLRTLLSGSFHKHANQMLMESSALVKSPSEDGPRPTLESIQPFACHSQLTRRVRSRPVYKATKYSKAI